MPSWSVASVVSCFRPFKSGTDGGYGNHQNTNGSKEKDIIYDEHRGTTVVELLKTSDSLGIIITGGVDKGTKPKISSLKPGSIAYRCDGLLVGDHVLSINGIRTSKLKHDEIVALLKNAGDKVILEIDYELPLPADEGCLCVCPKVIQLKLEKENNSFGFTLRGGSSTEKLKSRPLTIAHVRFGGPANREGSIKSGDRLISVDGINFVGATLHQALSILKQLSGQSIFTLEYDVSVIDAVRNASGPLLVEIDKPPTSQLGINLTCLLLPEPSIVIESIRQASIAERCGALHVGDHVLAIDDSKVDLMSSAEAMQLLKSSTGDTVKLEILPISQMIARRVPETNIKRGAPIPNYMAARMSYTNSCYNTLLSLSNFSSDMLASSSPNGYQKWNRSNFHPNGCNDSCNSSVSLGIVSNSCFPSVGHTDTTVIMLLADQQGFGFTVQGPTFTPDLVTVPAVISSIDTGSPAEKCGVLQVGDRILSVNGKSIDCLSLDDLSQLIVQSSPKIVLKTEFDVAGSVVPSSGTFVVKLAKRQSAGLGVTLAASKSRQPYEPLIISSVEKGSISHRSGTIQPGDRLLAVDQIRIENFTIEDAMNVLNSYGNEIISLRIRKDETYSDDPEMASAIVYTVELARHGGPLGITISGTEDPFDPIIISALTEDGLAERTRALHVGDRILAINGCYLHGKPLSEAIQILQSCGDDVTLKISRNHNVYNGENVSRFTRVPETNMNTLMTTIPSVDSALESWDSGNLEAGSSNTIKHNGCIFNQNLHTGECPPSTSRQSPDHFRSRTLDSRSHSALMRHVFAKSDSFSLRDNKEENWNKILEDLETCGQSQQLRQIEETILGNEDSQSSDNAFLNARLSIPGTSKRDSDTLSEKNLFELNAQIEQLGDRLHRNSCSDVPYHRRSCHQEFAPQCCSTSLGLASPTESVSSRPPIVPLYAVPFPVEVHKVTLFKDQLYEDFGFSISDGMYDHGVYIKCIRAGGPADQSGLIKPFDRILQVNGVKTYDYDCCLTVPLIASSGDLIELVLSRPAYENYSSSESTLGGACGHEPWTEDDNDEDNSLCHTPSNLQTMTKTV